MWVFCFFLGRGGGGVGFYTSTSYVTEFVWNLSYIQCCMICRLVLLDSCNNILCAWAAGCLNQDSGWHVFGLLQRSDRKYEEAIKCYRNALKWDKVRPFSLWSVGKFYSIRMVISYFPQNFSFNKNTPDETFCQSSISISKNWYKKKGQFSLILISCNTSDTVGQ